MKYFDAVIVGAGPAGSTLAWRLGDAGASVLVVDKARFPRDKPCGGGLTLRAVRQCPVDPSPVVEERVDALELRFRYGDAVVHHTAEPLIWMTQRRRLDAFLLDAARERGAEVLEGTTVRVGSGNEVVLDGGERVRAGAVVGADGANGLTAKAVELGGAIVHGLAYEGDVPYGTLSRERYARRAVVEFAGIPGGYGWVFPKGDHANVGVGAWQTEGPRIREHLARMCEAHGLDPEALENLRGHRLPMRRPGMRIAGERALLVGDAAGLLDPVSGDGMYECFVSSKLASAAILDLIGGRSPTLAPYAGAVDEALAPLHRASWKLKKAIDRWPRLTWRIARTKLLWVSIQRILEGDLAGPSEQRGVARVPLRVLDMLGR